MKQTVITLATIGTIVIIMAFSNSDNKSVGAIGDVKYSVLPPDKFKEENGNGWVLMDNNIPLQDSDLKSKHGITILPDARGLFIRSLNLNRNDDKADPFVKEHNSQQRLLGDYQDDGIKQHTHELEDNNLTFVSQHPSDRAEGGSDRPLSFGNQNHIVKVKREGDGLNPNETRPKNIALYTYIKIND